VKISERNMSLGVVISLVVRTVLAGDISSVVAERSDKNTSFRRMIFCKICQLFTIPLRPTDSRIALDSMEKPVDISGENKERLGTPYTKIWGVLIGYKYIDYVESLDLRSSMEGIIDSRLDGVEITDAATK